MIHPSGEAPENISNHLGAENTKKPFSASWRLNTFSGNYLIGQFDKNTVHAFHKYCRIIQLSTFTQQRLFEQQVRPVRKPLLVLFLFQVVNQRMLRIHFQHRLADRYIVPCLLHQLLHVNRHILLAQHQAGRRIGQPVADANVLYIIIQRFLDTLEKILVLSLDFFGGFLVFLVA